MINNGSFLKIHYDYFNYLKIDIWWGNYIESFE
jgi:hypothetical protein